MLLGSSCGTAIEEVSWLPNMLAGEMDKRSCNDQLDSSLTANLAFKDDYPC